MNNVLLDTPIYTTISPNDLTLNGLCSIRGIVQKRGINLPCRVRLYEKLTGLKRAETITDNNGNYKFVGLQPVEFFLVAHDPAQQYNAVIQDNVIPK